MYENELMHSGIKGMKWGVRRYQNQDGSLTDAGKRRYARDAKEQNWKIGDDGLARSQSKKTKGEIHEADPDKWFKEDIERSKRLADSSSDMSRKLNDINQRSIRNKPRKQMDLSNMTEQEMRSQINRAMLERQYNDMFNPQTVSKGRANVAKVLETTGTILTIGSSALGIALAIKELRGPALSHFGIKDM